MAKRGRRGGERRREREGPSRMRHVSSVEREEREESSSRAWSCDVTGGVLVWDIW